MKRMKTTTKRKIAGIVAIVLVVALLLSSVLPFFLMYARAEEAQENFTVEAVIGFDSGNVGKAGVIKLYNMNVFNITITNHSGDFNGYVQIPLYLYTKEKDIFNNYNSKFTISQGETKTLSISLPITSKKQNYFNINILDKNKKLLQSKTFYVECDSKQWVGVLSNNFDYTYILAKIRGIEICRYFMLQGNTLENYTYLSALKALIIDDFDTSSLTQTQLENLRQWIADGGILIVGLEGNVSKEDFDIITNGETSVNLPSVYDEYKDLINIYRYGNGAAVFNSFSLKTSDSMYSTAFNNELDYLFTTFKYNSSQNLSDKDGYYSRENYYSYNNSNGKMNIVPIVIFVGLYVYALAIGPILYFVLKRKNKKDLVIKILPSAAVVVTAIIFLLSINSEYNKTVISGILTMDVSDMSADIADASFDYMVTSPHKGKISLSVNNENAKIIGVDEYKYFAPNSYNYEKNRSDTFAEINTDDNTAEILRSAVWQQNIISVNNSINLKGSLENNISYSYGRLSGSVTNNTGYDLTDCFVGVKHSYEYSVYYVDRLADGETYTIDDSEAKQFNYYQIRDIYLEGNYDMEYYKFAAVFNTLKNQSERCFVTGYSDVLDDIISVTDRSVLDRTGTLFTNIQYIDSNIF